MMKCKLKLPRQKLYFLKSLVLFENELEQFMILAKNENITNPISIHQLILRGLQSTFPKAEAILNVGLRIYLAISISIGVNFGGRQPRHAPPKNKRTPMHLSVFTTFFPKKFGFATQYF